MQFMRRLAKSFLVIDALSLVVINIYYIFTFAILKGKMEFKVADPKLKYKLVVAPLTTAASKHFDYNYNIGN